MVTVEKVFMEAILRKPESWRIFNKGLSILFSAVAGVESQSSVFLKR